MQGGEAGNGSDDARFKMDGGYIPRIYFADQFQVVNIVCVQLFNR
jgi:hypothetical protein